MFDCTSHSGSRSPFCQPSSVRWLFVDLFPTWRRQGRNRHTNHRTHIETSHSVTFHVFYVPDHCSTADKTKTKDKGCMHEKKTSLAIFYTQELRDGSRESNLPICLFFPDVFQCMNSLWPWRLLCVRQSVCFGCFTVAVHHPRSAVTCHWFSFNLHTLFGLSNSGAQSPFWHSLKNTNPSKRSLMDVEEQCSRKRLKFQIYVNMNRLRTGVGVRGLSSFEWAYCTFGF